MPDQPSDPKRIEAGRPIDDDDPGAAHGRSYQPLERRRFGGTAHPHERHHDEAPVARGDLSKGPRSCWRTGRRGLTGACSGSRRV